MFVEPHMPKSLSLSGLHLTQAQKDALMSNRKQTLVIDCLTVAMSRAAHPKAPFNLEVLLTGPVTVAYPISDVLEANEQLKELGALKDEMIALHQQQIAQLKEELELVRSSSAKKDEMIAMLKKAARL